MTTEQYQAGVRVKIVNGLYKDRTGVIKRRGSAVFPNMCKIIIDLTKRERVEKTAIIEYKDLEIIQP